MNRPTFSIMDGVSMSAKNKKKLSINCKSKNDHIQIYPKYLPIIATDQNISLKSDESI